MAISIVKLSDSPTETKAYWTFSEFGTSNTFLAYTYVSLLIEILIPILVLAVMNTISVVKFKSMMAQKEQLIASHCTDNHLSVHSDL